ncbi:hypothetical protein T4E_1575 [Trichinella pseudospiralis]|uniref:Transmembrane protein n=1 Tax=Trichinella pseudospiralis TaxID=6337 RepID=A0A0V0XTA6_TRIPS|nr:hypothetical protein T4E_1575 [Trichinella pseudospiralis]
MIKHRYGDPYLHNEALETPSRGLAFSEDLLSIGHFIFGFIFTLYVFIKLSSFNWNHLIFYFVAICFPICALLILLRHMQVQLKEQKSY